MDSLDILEALVSFPTVSKESNLSLIAYVADLLGSCGAEVRLLHNTSGEKANLFATIGPRDVPGVVLSGHSDVVPVEGQDWSCAPFAMTERDGRIYGRGTADMKGFVACALGACIKASRTKLKTPLHLALSYDEEIGCVGVRSLVDMLREASARPLLCIVGEPTQMRTAIGHKGKVSAVASCRGREGHSALAPLALNALHLGCDFIGALRREQDRLAHEGNRDPDYAVPYTTVHAGTMTGGVALNIVPRLCTIAFEIRNLAADKPQDSLERLRAEAARIVRAHAGVFPEAAIDIEVTNTYPGLDTAPDSGAVAFIRTLTGITGTTKVAFGTEAGLFSRDLGIPTVVCGPGSMEQGHKPDEFVSLDQIRQCDAALEKLVSSLAAGTLATTQVSDLAGRG